MEELQAHLRDAPDAPMSKEMEMLVKKMRKEFLVKNAKACHDLEKKNMELMEARWAASTIQEKADMDPGRFKEEYFPKGKLDAKPVVINVGAEHAVMYMLQASSRLTYKSLLLTKGHPEKDEDHDRVIILGPSSISKTFAKNKEWIAAQEANEQAQKQYEKKAKRELHHVLKATGTGKEWLVAGRYNIDCPAVTDQWDHKDLWLDLFIKDTGNGKGSQMFAEFDFGVLKGIMRFERQTSDKKSALKNKTLIQPPNSRKRTREEYESNDEENEESDDYDRSRSLTPENFYLGKILYPSEKHPTWNYQWRGGETGEGVIEVGEESYKVKFCEPRGTRIEGTFGAGLFGDITFTGIKTLEKGNENVEDPSEQWHDRNEDAYESARVGRWH